MFPVPGSRPRRHQHARHLQHSSFHSSSKGFSGVFEEAVAGPGTSPAAPPAGPRGRVKFSGSAEMFSRPISLDFFKNRYIFHNWQNHCFLHFTKENKWFRWYGIQWISSTSQKTKETKGSWKVGKRKKGNPKNETWCFWQLWDFFRLAGSWDFFKKYKKYLKIPGKF